MSAMSLRQLAAVLPLRAQAPRRIASLSLFAATGLLTAAIFLLPATSEHRAAQASAASAVDVAAAHVQIEKVTQVSTLRR